MKITTGLALMAALGAAVALSASARADDAAQPIPAPVAATPAPAGQVGAYLLIHANPADITVAMQSSAACETEVVRIAKAFKAACVHMDGK